MRWTGEAISLFLFLGVLNVAAAQESKATADQGTNEFYGMKLVLVPGAGTKDGNVGQSEETWVNTNNHAVTAAWKVKAKDGTTKVQSEVFSAKEQRPVVFPDGTVSARMFLAYKDDMERWRQQNIEDFKYGGGKEKLEGEDSLN
jgi:hypothetical protein